jgi:hypothetical protein
MKKKEVVFKKHSVLLVSGNGNLRSALAAVMSPST